MTKILRIFSLRFNLPSQVPSYLIPSLIAIGNSKLNAGAYPPIPVTITFQTRFINHFELSGSIHLPETLFFFFWSYRHKNAFDPIPCRKENGEIGVLLTELNTLQLIRLNNDLNPPLKEATGPLDRAGTTADTAQESQQFSSPLDLG